MNNYNDRPASSINRLQSAAITWPKPFKSCHMDSRPTERILTAEHSELYKLRHIGLDQGNLTLKETLDYENWLSFQLLKTSKLNA